MLQFTDQFSAREKAMPSRDGRLVDRGADDLQEDELSSPQGCTNPLTAVAPESFRPRAGADVQRSRWLGRAILSVGGIGFIPRGAATAGTLAGAASFMALRPSVRVRIALLATATCLGQTWAPRFITPHDHDPQFIVIDELAGVWLALVAAPISTFNCSVGAVAFRIFDKLKPGPIGLVDRSSGAWSVMCDDLLAGLAAGLVVYTEAAIRDRVG